MMSLGCDLLFSKHWSQLKTNNFIFPTSVADPAFHFDANPDPTFHSDSDPDHFFQFDPDPITHFLPPAFHFDADPDPQYCFLPLHRTIFILHTA